MQVFRFKAAPGQHPLQAGLRKDLLHAAQALVAPRTRGWPPWLASSCLHNTPHGRAHGAMHRCRYQPHQLLAVGSLTQTGNVLLTQTRCL